jgi:type II secretory pathway pseudopilin PulG
VRLKDPDKRPWRSRLREQRGSVLVEVMVGAVVLSIATAALLNGIDGAQSAGTKNKARSTAAALAEQDQERMRSLPVATLAGYSNTRTASVKGVNYTVTSSTQWVTDQGGPISCSNNNKTAANIRITSAVTANAYTGVVDEVSLVTPPPGTFAPGEGRAIVKVNGASGAAVSGAGVSLTGPSSYSGTTNSLGCAVFPFVAQGAYTATVSGGSLVDWQGNSSATKAIGVTAGTSTTISLEMDTAAEIRAIFDTVVNGTTVAAKSPSLTLGNAKLSVGAKTFPTSPGAPVTNINAQNLFPFTDGYGAFAGQCSTNNPALAPTSNNSLLPVYTPTPGQVLTMTTSNDVRVPSINVQVVTASGSAVSNTTPATVIVKTADSGCTNTFPTQTTTSKTYGTTTYTATLPEPGFPYGTYRICAQTSPTAGPHGHADIYNSFTGGYDAKSTSTVAAETATNRVDDLVSNTAAGGNSATPSTNGHIRIRLNRSGVCE